MALSRGQKMDQEKKSEYITIALTRTEKNELQQMAEEEERPLAQMARILLIRKLKAERGQK